MSFTSLEFLLLIALALAVYYLVPKKWQYLVLLAASYVFYMYAGVALTGYLLAATAITYLAGRKLSALNALKGSVDKSVLKRRKRLVAAAALVLNFGMLYMLKYLDGTLALITGIFGMNSIRVNILVPLGVSYYIFQSCGYVVDCYRGKWPCEKNFLKYALFVSFFPQIIQGPIGRHHDLAPQLTKEHPFDAENLRRGIQLAMWGYFKKLVIADRVGELVGTVFGNYNAYSGSIIVLAVFCYCIQLYCDFSGGIDIARGVASMFGIELAENFRRPIFAVSVADYWRRWHITLGSWMRDYVFYPISLSKPFSRLGKFSRKKFGGIFGKILPTSLATFIVYLIIGIWHGSSPKYIVFGFWNGIIITASLLLEPVFEKLCSGLKIDRQGNVWRVFRICRTAVIIFIGRYLTRAASLSDALAMLKASVCRFDFSSLINGTELSLGMTKTDYIVVFFGVLAMLILEFLQERGMHVRDTLAKQRFFVQYLGILVPLAAVLILGVWIKGDISTGFIYMQF
jgi:D-alanyl-lipoteichoic acid acyltransferase DltB (MBOAT superfamily)